MSSVVKKITYSIVLRFPLFDVDVSKELSESQLHQFYGEVKRLETAVADQLGKFASVIAAPSHQTQTQRENMARIMQYAQDKDKDKDKTFFRAKDVELDLGLSDGSVYSALSKLVAEKRLTRMKLHPGGAYGYRLVKQNGSALAVEIEGEEAKAIREDLKRLDAAEVQARLDSN